MKKIYRVALLMGGTSAEREVSLVSGKACLTALCALGHEVRSFDPKEESWISALQTFAPTVVMNALHGTPGEDGTIQGILELLRIPYTHCGVLASSLAMDKALSKVLFRVAGVPTPSWQVLSWETLHLKDPFPRPFILKPLREGSSLGVHIIEKETDLSILREKWLFGEQLLVEEYIPGRELTVCVLGDKALCVTEIVSKRNFFDYDAKYVEGLSEHFVHVALPGDAYQRALDCAVRASKILQCRGATRADIRYNPQMPVPHDLYVLEINTQPGLTPISLLPEQARYAGISFQDLIQWMLEQAQCDCDG
ncbi:MAG: D-alanine--D-alanine ligase [Holosporales bacterium]|jgi:D-alanine-D-alanine ligase|nr:D-alanine--D-alanine ligase [Holosporales bacterium]